jgi:hypothetical protein
MGKGSRRSRRSADGHRPLDEARARGGFPSRQSAHDGEWMVRPAGPGAKPYPCPGCGREIPAGAPSLVVWQAEGLLGETEAISARRHWHPACWRERSRRH